MGWSWVRVWKCRGSRFRGRGLRDEGGGEDGGEGRPGGFYSQRKTKGWRLEAGGGELGLNSEKARDKVRDER